MNAPEAPGRDLLAEVRAAVTEILPGLPVAEITPDVSLADLGADSVDRVEILGLLAHRLGRDETPADFAGLPHIGALIAYLQGEDGQ